MNDIKNISPQENSNLSAAKQKNSRIFLLFSLTGWLIALSTFFILKNYPQYLCKNNNLVAHSNVDNNSNHPISPNNNSIIAKPSISPLKQIVSAVNQEKEDQHNHSDDSIAMVDKFSKTDNLNFHLLLTVMSINDLASKNKNFDPELRKLLIIGKKYPTIFPEIKKLENFSQSGVFTLKQLQDQFDLLSSQITKQELVQKRDNKVTATLISYLSKVIDIKKIDPSSTGEDSISILSRSYWLIHNGNIDSAINELNKLPNSQKEIIKNWLISAQNYTEYNKTINTIFEYTKLLVYNLPE